MKKPLFLILAALCAWPAVSPAVALTAGLAFSLSVGNPWPAGTARWTKRTLKLSVVGLGFGLGLEQVWSAGRDSFLYTAVSVAFVITVGRLLARWLRVQSNTGALVAFGTAICGGSAIAAMAPVIQADDDETAVALSTVFALNAAALLLFPFMGHLVGLDQRQFGLWSALAIHDTSSVVGAASAYGATALAVGATVKLVRACWIVPCALSTAWVRKSEGKVRFPWFILGFVAAAGVRSLLPSAAPVWSTAAGVARQGLVVTLFLVGAGLSREVLRRVGLRPFAQGVLLWAIVGSVSLLAIVEGWIV